MYYDDETRQFNLVSGLVFGLVLGAGLALLRLPQERVPPRRKSRGRSSRLRGQLQEGLQGLRWGATETLVERLAAAASSADPRTRR